MRGSKCRTLAMIKGRPLLVNSLLLLPTSPLFDCLCYTLTSLHLVEPA